MKNGDIKTKLGEFAKGCKKVFVLTLIAWFVGFGFTFGAATFLKYDKVIGDSFIAIMQIDLEKQQ